jgi:sterol desaturase/sphingolipid hydroxylase (fatty acid hydroxylase superfamily)
MMTSIWAFAVDFTQRFFNEAPVTLWLGAFTIGIIFETLLPKAQAGNTLRARATNITHSLIYLGAIFIFAPSIFTFVAFIRNTLGIHGLINLQVFDNSTYLHQTIIFIIYLFVIDFFQYLWHRAQHRFPILWDQHVVHHSDVTMNVTTATRHHWTEFAFQAFTIALPFTILFNISPTGAGVVSVVFSGWQFFVHMNVRIHLGPFAWIAAGPQVHRIHHSILPEHRDKNFAAYFPIWDVIFGTYHHPTRNEFPETGVKNIALETIWSLSMHPFKQWSRRVMKRLKPVKLFDRSVAD